MSDERRRELEERLVYLRIILDFYVAQSDEIKSMTRTEVEAYIDVILDDIIETKNELNDEDRGDTKPDS